MEELLKLLEEVKPGVDFTSENNLIDDHILDSLSIVMLVNAIDDEFDITVTPLDVVPENFKSAKTIYSMIQRIEEEGE